MINHKYKFIYTRIGKTASTSVTRVLKNIEGKKTHHGHHHILYDINPRTKDYFKFTFVKNPWARLVSRYFFLLQTNRYRQFVPKQGLNFDSFKAFVKSDWPGEPRPPLKGKLRGPFVNQIDWISDENGVVLTDFIGRFENLQEDFNIVCDKVGIPQRKLPHEQKSKHKHYTEYYDEETRQIVAEKYAKDIEQFGYEFGN